MSYELMRLMDTIVILDMEVVLLCLRLFRIGAASFAVRVFDLVS